MKLLDIFRKQRPRPVLVAEDTMQPGEPTTLVGDSPNTKWGAVFEDDGETGYFYGLDRTLEEQPILDALHIYNVGNVTDRQRSSLFQIVWSADGLKVALFINDHCHAAFDFGLRRGYCRTNFPQPLSGGFSAQGHEWSDEVLRWF